MGRRLGRGLRQQATFLRGATQDDLIDVTGVSSLPALQQAVLTDVDVGVAGASSLPAFTQAAFLREWAGSNQLNAASTLPALTQARSYRDVVLSDAPVSYWRLGEASGVTAVDEMGVNPGTYVNTPTLGAAGALSGDPDTAATFNGTTQGISITDSASLDCLQGTHAFTIEAWVDYTPTANYQTVLDTYGAAGTYVQALILTDLGFSISRINAGGSEAAVAALTPGWHHVVGTYNGAVLTAYVDGVPGTPVASTRDIGATLANLTFAKRWSDVNGIAGSLDEPAIYDRALTAAEVAGHYAAGLPDVRLDVLAIVASALAAFTQEADVSIAGETWREVDVASTLPAFTQDAEARLDVLAIVASYAGGPDLLTARESEMEPGNVVADVLWNPNGAGGPSPTLTSDTSEYHGGAASVKVVVLAGNYGAAYVLRAVPVEFGVNYEMSVWVKSDGVGTEQLRLTIYEYTDVGGWVGSSLGPGFAPTTSWVRHTRSYTPSVGTVAIGRPAVGNTTNAAVTFFIDDASFAESPISTLPALTQTADVRLDVFAVAASILPAITQAGRLLVPGHRPTGVWKMDIYDLAGAPVLLDAPFGSCDVTWSLNDPGGLDADFALSAVTLAELNPDLGREVKLTRQDVVVWGGYLERVSFDISGEQRVKIQAEGYLARLAGLFVQTDLQFNDAAQQDIAWGLIAAAQALANGNYGFVQGVHVGSSPQRTRTYCAAERPNVLDEIAVFAEKDNGLDFAINPLTKGFDTWSPKKETASGVTIGPGTMDISGEIDLVDVANYVAGMGENKCGAVIRTASNGTSGTRIGRRGALVSSRGDRVPEILEDAREYLRAHEDARWQIAVTYHEEDEPTWGRYGIGDTVSLEVAEGFATFTKTVRLLERHLRIQPPSDAAVFIEEVLESAL